LKATAHCRFRPTNRRPGSRRPPPVPARDVARNRRHAIPRRNNSDCAVVDGSCAVAERAGTAVSGRATVSISRESRPTVPSHIYGLGRAATADRCTPRRSADQQGHTSTEDQPVTRCAAGAAESCDTFCARTPCTILQNSKHFCRSMQCTRRKTRSKVLAADRPTAVCAARSQRGGREFEPPAVHHPLLSIACGGCRPWPWRRRTCHCHSESYMSLCLRPTPPSRSTASVS
jgi:hypothetical protein